MTERQIHKPPPKDNRRFVVVYLQNDSPPQCRTGGYFNGPDEAKNFVQSMEGKGHIKKAWMEDTRPLEGLSQTPANCDKRVYSTYVHTGGEDMLKMGAPDNLHAIAGHIRVLLSSTHIQHTVVTCRAERIPPTPPPHRWLPHRDKQQAAGF